MVTGGWKTYLAAFDAKNYDAKHLLFVVHRDAILVSAKNTFPKIFGVGSYGLYTGKKQKYIAMSNYYNENLKEFIEDTFSCDMSLEYHFFEQYLTCARTILDLGFGSGRDSLYFKNNGYEVYSLDPTLEFCQNESSWYEIQKHFWWHLGMCFITSRSIKWIKWYFKKCSDALKSKEIIYASFKYGSFDGQRNGRFFLDLDEKSIKKYLIDTNLSIVDTKITEDVRANRNTKWLNLILRKIN